MIIEQNKNVQHQVSMSRSSVEVDSNDSRSRFRTFDIDLQHITTIKNGLTVG